MLPEVYRGWNFEDCQDSMKIMFSSWIIPFAFLSCCALVKAQSVENDCSADTRRMCRRNIEDVLESTNRRLEQEDLCWRIRQNFDCMIWQTSMCLNQDQQERNKDIIDKGWKYMTINCENFKNYWTKVCFRSERLKRCEKMLGSRNRPSDYDSCRKYLNFRECAILTIQSECNSDDQRLLGVYLRDKGDDRSWNCPTNARSYSELPMNSPLASNNRGASVEDGVLADSPGTTCLYKSQQSTQTCLASYEDVKKESRDLLDEDKREEKLCCALSKYENCVFSELKEHCGSGVNDIVKQLLASAKKNSNYNCEKIDEATCSGPITAAITYATIICGIFLSFVFTFFV